MVRSTLRSGDGERALLGLASVAHADFAKTYSQLKKLGLSIPGWFINPDTPARDGDGRPKTPLAETVSSMLLLTIGQDGLPHARS